jgi:6-phosphogluconolactonase/glucosamine-6-phosphate isomerase/deaminase
VVEKNSIKNPRERITLSYSRLNQSKNVFKIINGSSKKNTVQLLIAGQSSLPINRVTGEFEKCFICNNAL